MTADLKTQIRDFAQGFASVLPPIEFEELMRSQVVARSQPPKRRRGWVVALATAAAVLVLVGGVALLLDSADPVPPVVTQPPTPTTTVPVTVAPDSPVTETTAITVETTLAGSLEPPSPSTTLSTANSVLSDEPISGDDLGVAIAVSSSIADIRVGRDAVWVGDVENPSLHRIDPSTNQVVDSIKLGDGGRDGAQQPRFSQSIAIGEESVWVGDINNAEVAGYTVVTGSLIGDWTLVGYPSQVAIGEGPVWAVDVEGLYRFDERTGDVVAVIEPGTEGSFWWVTAGQGTVWVAALPDEFPWRLIEVDPSTNSIVSGTDLPEINLALVAYDVLAATDDAIWVAGGNCSCPGERPEGEGRGRIIKLDPTDGQILASASGDFGPFDIAVGPRYIWVVNAIDDDTRTVIRLDPQSLQIVGGPLVFDSRPTAIDIGHESLWVSHGLNGSVTRIQLADLP